MPTGISLVRIEGCTPLDEPSLFIAVISTLISSIALIGVMIGLLLQVRQLQIGRLQARLASHHELVRMGLEHPAAWVSPSDQISKDPESFKRNILMNWQIQHLQFGFVIKEIPEVAVRWECTRLFAARYRREWWSMARESYTISPRSRRHRRFVKIVDEECRRAVAQYPRPPDAAKRS